MILSAFLQYAYDFFVPFHIISPIFFLKNRIFGNFYELFKRNEKSRNGCDFLTQKTIITAAVTVINRSAPRENPGTGL